MTEYGSLPSAFLHRLEAIVPADRIDAVRSTFSGPRDVGFRVNTLRAVIPDVLARLRADGLNPEPVPWFGSGFIIEEADRNRLLDCGPYREGLIWVQNLSSMIPPLALEPRAGASVLDLAAAPGSKTLQIACLMEGRGELAAVEPVRGRFFRLRRNLDAQGAGMVRTFMKDGTGIWRHRPDYFDHVLIDAPCSTEGQMRSDDPASSAHWSVRKVRQAAGKQRRLLESAVRCARPGGIVVYSTCSFAPEENEAVVDHVLGKFGEALSVESVPVDCDAFAAPLARWQDQDFDPRIANTRRILPDRRMEAFFVARLRKTAPTG